MVCLPTWAATHGNQPSRLQSAQAVTDIALITSQRLHPFERSRATAALGVLILGPHIAEDLALQFRKTSCRHEDALDSAAIGSGR